EKIDQNKSKGRGFNGSGGFSRIQIRFNPLNPASSASFALLSSENELRIYRDRRTKLAQFPQFLDRFVRYGDTSCRPVFVRTVAVDADFPAKFGVPRRPQFKIQPFDDLPIALLRNQTFLFAFECIVGVWITQS